MSRALPQVKNRAPAPIQISAEQLIKEAQHRGLEDVLAAPKQYIADAEELAAYQLDKRKDFESQVQRHRNQMGIWCRYALWEASLKEYDRARSVFERALQFNYKDEMTWAKYGEMEMKAKFVNHARNVWDRAVTLLPRVDQFWYKYTYMEELLGSGSVGMSLARGVFERWMQWEPDESAWAAYVKFEMRQADIARARAVYERFALCHAQPSSYLKFARWEEKNGDKLRAREVFERAVEVLPAEAAQALYASFGQFEERCQEFERARLIYRYAIDVGQRGGYLAEDALAELRTALVAFEKRHGSRSGIEEVILNKRREQYEATLASLPLSYDTWMDLATLEEAEAEAGGGGGGGGGDGDASAAAVRAVYERAVIHVPPVQEKHFWRRYMYLWICWALFEELQCKDKERAREVYRRALAVIPHKLFTFGKMWLLAAELEIRCKDLAAARKILGIACGKCAHLMKSSIYRKYIALESQMGEVDRCRAIYAKWLETIPEHCGAWIGLARLEASVGEAVRSRAVYELAVQQTVLDAPEELWKSYLDFECDEGQADNVRALYGRLLDMTQHVRVWIALATFEVEGGGASAAAAAAAAADSAAGIAAIDADADGSKPPLQLGGLVAARAVFSRAYDTLRTAGRKEERVALLGAWRDLELRTAGGRVADVDAKMPRKIKVRRTASSSSGGDEPAADWGEDYDYIFPDDESNAPGLKLLENAKKWKAAAVAAAAAAAAAAAGTDAPDRVVHSAAGERDSAYPAQEQEQEQEKEASLGKRKHPPPPAQSGPGHREEIDIDDL